MRARIHRTSSSKARRRERETHDDHDPALEWRAEHEHELKRHADAGDTAEICDAEGAHEPARRAPRTEQPKQACPGEKEEQIARNESDHIASHQRSTLPR